MVSVAALWQKPALETKYLKVGRIVSALETKVNAKGVLRVRLAEGWVSEKAGDGTLLLQRLSTKGGESTESDESGSEGTESETAKSVASSSLEPEPELGAESAGSGTDETATFESDSDGDFPRPRVEKVRPKFKVLKKAVLRQGFAMNSVRTAFPL